MTYPTPPFTLHRPKTAEEAVSLAQSHPGALFLAGGTDLMVNIRKRLHEPDHLIDLKAIESLQGVREAGDGSGDVVIGALTSLHTLATNPLLAKHAPFLAQAAGLVAGPTLRNMGTLGGNLTQDTRCRYYNQSFFWRQANDFCLKKDGTVCHVAPKGSFCWAAYSGDTAPALMVLDATVTLVGKTGPRSVPLSDLYGTDGRYPVGGADGGLAPGELLTEVRFTPRGWKGVYEKLRMRNSIDYPLVGVALAIKRNDSGLLDGIALALTAVAPRPVQVGGVEALVGKPFDAEAVEVLKSLANRAGKPMRTTVTDPAYRRSMISSLVEKTAIALEPALKKSFTQSQTG